MLYVCLMRERTVRHGKKWHAGKVRHVEKRLDEKQISQNICKE